LSSLPFDHPGARIAFHIVVGAFVLSELRVRLRSGRNPHGSQLDRTSLLVVQASAIAGVGGAVLLARRASGFAIAHNGWPLFVFGLVLMHLSYTGLIVTFVGFGLALGNWASLAVLAVLPTAGLVYRIRFEERALLEGLGESYRRYAEGRPRLLPGVW